MTQRRALAVLMVCSALAVLPQVAARAAAPSVPPPAGTYVVPAPAGGVGPFVISGDHVYAINAGEPSKIEVLNLATGQFEAPIPYRGAFDLSPDGRTLYVVNGGSLVVVDVASRTEVRRIALPGAGVQWQYQSLAVASNATALATRPGDLAGGPAVVQINLATGAVTPRLDWVGPANGARASGDHSRIAVTGGGVNPVVGTVALYDAATDRFTANRRLDGETSRVALDAAGSVMFVGPGGFVVGADGALRATIPFGTQSSYGAVNPQGTTVYRAAENQGFIEVFDLARAGAPSGLINVPGGSGGLIDVTPDGTKLVMAAKAGFVVIPVGPTTYTCPGSPPGGGLLGTCFTEAGDLVLDGHGRAYASDVARNQLDVINMAGRSLEAPIPVGSHPTDLDVTPDGRTLVALDTGADEVSIVDLTARRETRRVVLPTDRAAGDLPLALAVAANGTALVSTRRLDPPLAALHLWQVDLTTGAVRARPEQPPMLLAASGDHTKIVAAPIGSGVALYSSATDRFGPSKYVEGATTMAALDQTGDRILLGPGASGETLFDGDLVRRATFPAFGDGLAMDGRGTRGFRLIGGAEIRGLDLNGALTTSSVPLPQPLPGAIYVPVQFAVTPDGATAVVASYGGFAVVSLASPTPMPVCGPPPQLTSLTAICGLLGVVAVDGSNRAWSTNVARNQVEVVDLATGVAGTPIPVGSEPLGLDFSPDGKLLYVADAGSQEISVVDVEARQELRRFTITTPFDDDRPGTLAVAANGRAVFTTWASAGGPGHLWELDPTSGAIVLKGAVGPNTQVRANPDRSQVAVLDGAGAYQVYASATRTVTAGAPAQPARFGLEGTVSVDGRTGYRLASDPTKRIEVVDLASGSVTRAMVLSDFPYVRPSQLTLSRDGAWLAIVTEYGVFVYNTQSASLQEPSTTFSAPGQFDGMGTWMGIVNEPTPAPGAGQHANSYLYAQFFNFFGAQGTGYPQGLVGLVDDASGKYAVVALVGPDGATQSAAVPFNWTAGNFYFPFVYELAPGQLGAWVYDNTAGRWVGIAVLTVPTWWGKINALDSATSLRWLGRPAATCASYPKADVVMYTPHAYVGGAATPLTSYGPFAKPGDCAAVTTDLGGGWTRYQAGQ